MTPRLLVPLVYRQTSASIPRRIALTLEVDATVADVHADASQLKQLVMNLLFNAIDALSGGQYQLLCVWAALGSGTDLVMLDEPTNNLDPPTEALLIEILAAERGRRAVLLVSHERHFLDEACSRVLTVAAWHGGD